MESRSRVSSVGGLENTNVKTQRLLNPCRATHRNDRDVRSHRPHCARVSVRVQLAHLLPGPGRRDFHARRLGKDPVDPIRAPLFSSPGGLGWVADRANDHTIGRFRACGRCSGKGQGLWELGPLGWPSSPYEESRAVWKNFIQVFLVCGKVWSRP